jgi:hypothetical protein
MWAMESSDIPVTPLSAARLDRSVAAFGAPDDADERTYWHACAPAQRLAATELLRQINYGDAATSARLQRVFEFAELGAG